MTKLLKFLKPYAGAVAAIICVLIVQAYCDLSLPAYTSDIVNVGIQQSGIDEKVPEQISVVSFDNIVFSSLYDIGLTTVSQHVREMSEHAARLMLKQLKTPREKPERVILDPTLIVRRTTCPYVPEQDGE